MGTTTITLSTIASFFFVILFLYLLYIIGGLSQNAKKILQKIEEIEKMKQKAPKEGHMLEWLKKQIEEQGEASA